MMQSYNSSCYREHQDWEEITCDDCREEETEHVWRPVHVCVCVIFILSVTKCCVQRSHNFIIIFGRKKLVHDESLMCLFYFS